MKKDAKCRTFLVFNPRSVIVAWTPQNPVNAPLLIHIFRTPRPLLHTYTIDNGPALAEFWAAVRKESTSTRKRMMIYYYCILLPCKRRSTFGLNYEYTHLPSRTTHHTHIKTSPQFDCTTESRLNTQHPTIISCQPSNSHDFIIIIPFFSISQIDF